MEANSSLDELDIILSVEDSDNTTSDYSDGSVISDDLMRLFRLVNYTFICQAIDVFGVITNIINMIIFVQIGFKDTINISLFALAISDFFGCLTLIWLNLAMTPWFNELEFTFDPLHVQYLTGGWPHVIFTRITSVITAFITFERCLCVLLPLKIKTILSRRRVTIFLISAYILTTACFIPVYLTNKLSWTWFPDQNRSILILVFTEDRVEVENIHWPLVSIILPFLIFLFVTVCTALLISSLNKKAKWRETATKVSKASEMSSKEKKISTLVATISTLFIICFLPVIVATFGMVSDREFNVTGKRWRLFNVLFSFIFIFESFNASMNIFIYYYKSTNYRTMFNKIFRRKTTEVAS